MGGKEQLIHDTVIHCSGIKCSNVRLTSRFSDLKSFEAGVGCKIGVGFKIESLPFWHFSCAKEGNFSLAKIFKKKILKPKTQDRLILNS